MIAAADATGVRYEVVECVPELADPDEVFDRYGVALEKRVNLRVAAG